jgi:putative N6-adenine-specific DNA methylase
LSYHKYIAKTFAGLEPVLEKELQEIGIEDCTILKRSVAFECSFEHLMLANMSLRTAIRIYRPLFEFQVIDEEDLYQNILKFNWEEWLTLDNTFAIESIVNSQQFVNSHFISLKSKDAIVDHFYFKYKKRPNVDIKEPHFRIQVHISSLNKCTISVDTSGEALYKRGYKNRQTEASINECLASGMILMSNWDRKKDFYDPMCGSGTIFIEAAMIASNYPPNLKRKKWGFFYFKEFDKTKYEKLRAIVESQIKISEVNFYVNDLAGKSLDIAKMNYFDTNIDLPYIYFSKENFFEMQPKSKEGIMIINPPYNERIELNNEDLWYKDLGDIFKNFYKGFDIWLISSNKSALRKIGLKDSTRFQLMNGGLNCEYCHYEIF